VDDATTLQDAPPVDIDALVEGATDRVKAMTADDLKALSTDEKNQLVKDLTAGGKPSGDAQKALRNIYRSMDLDPTFQAKDDLRMKDVANALKGNEDLQSARANWPSIGWDERRDALKKIVDAQSEAYGIDSPEIELFDEPMGKNGIIRSGSFQDGKIFVNTNPKSSFNDFNNAVRYIAHETAHGYQDELIDQLGSGELLPGDDEYEQATMFDANNRNGAYVRANSRADMPDYKKQPLEQHAFWTGDKLANAIIGEL
jgi:hypothetical protein